jgi:hypothetical protein
MNTDSLVRAVALLARIQPLLITFYEEKEYYKGILEKNEKSEKNDFLIKKTESHMDDLQKVTCMIETLLYPDCQEPLQDPDGLLKFLESNQLIKAKLLEKMKGTPNVQ